MKEARFKVAVLESLQRLRRDFERHGARNALYAAGLRLINRVFVLRILRGLHVEAPNPAFFRCAQTQAAEFVRGAKLREYARDAATTKINDTFLDSALARGDECYAICEGTTLAAYTWYASGPTPIAIGELAVSCDPQYVYMYKGFTLGRYRGRRLYPTGMTRALLHYRNRGYRGLVCYVEAHNLDSLKSCLRMGYRTFGSIYVIRLFGRYFGFSSPGCERFAFRLSEVRSAVAALGYGKN
jgi:hypothetical protein